MNSNNITFRVPVTTYKDFTLSNGLGMVLKHLLFPETQYIRDLDKYVTPNSQKVLAIKAVRADLGIGLKEAKDFIDALTPKLLDQALNGTGYDPSGIPGTVTLGELIRSKLSGAEVKDY